MIRQGDVLIKPIDKLPEGLVKATDKVLQESETTGHHHHFKPDAAVAVYRTPETQYTIDEGGIIRITANKQTYMEVTEDTYLYHGKLFDYQPHAKGTGDHDAVIVPPGVYEIDIIREYNPEFKSVNRVVD